MRPSLKKRSATRLLGRDDVLGDRADRKGERLAATVWMSSGNAGDGAQRFRHLVAVRLRPLRGRGRHIDDLLQDRPVAFGEIAVGDDRTRLVLVISEALTRIRPFCLVLADREIRIPDRPCIDAAIGEGGPGIRRRQIDRRDIGVGQAGLFQRLHDDVMGAGALGEADALALQIRDACGSVEWPGTRMPCPLVIG